MKIKKGYNYKKILGIIFLFLLLIGLMTHVLSDVIINNSSEPQENQDIRLTLLIPAKNSDIYMKDKLICEENSTYPIKIEIKNIGIITLNNITIEIVLPPILKIMFNNINPSNYIKSNDSAIGINISSLNSGFNNTITFNIKINNSLPYSQKEIIRIKISYIKESSACFFNYSHQFEVVPPPSWIIYLTIISGIALFVFIIYFSKKSGLLEKFTTMDLINIAILSSLGVIVFKWIWQIFNDFLGIFGGLLMTIPASTLMIIAICLVKKPGTATLFFINWELVNFIMWGSSIHIWLGWYILEGVAVDLCIVILKDYGEKLWTSALYGLVRCFLAYYMNYCWFSPAIWKIYYAPWYVWLQILIGCIGGVIGGINGQRLGKKLKEAIIIS